MSASKLQHAHHRAILLVACRAACAVMGFVGTWVGQALIASIGLLRTGVCALLLQAGSLALAAVIYR